MAPHGIVQPRQLLTRRQMASDTSTQSSHHKLGGRQVLLVLLFFTVATVAFTWPLALRAPAGVVGRHGDNMHFVWMVGWFEQSLLHDYRLPYQVPVLNFPEGWEMARSEIPTTLVLLGLLPGALAEPVLGYNVAVLGSFILSGLAMFLWVRRLTGNVWSGLIAGVAYAFLPFRIAHFRAGHLNVLATMWFPLLFWGLAEVLSDRDAPRRYAILAGLSIGLLSHSSQYATYITLLVLVVSVAVFLLGFRHRRLRDPALWRQLAWMTGAGIPLLLTGVWPYLTLSAEGALPARSVFAVAGGSASLTDFVLPSTDHFLWGRWVADTFPRDQWIEGSLYLGAVSLPLAVIGSTAKRIRRFLPLLLLIFLCGLIVALGTHLHWNEELVRLRLPLPLQGLLGRDDIAIRLPAFYLYGRLPFFDRLRTFKRAAVLPLTVVCALAGVGVDVIRRRATHRRAIPWLILGLLLLDIYPGPFSQFAAVGPRPVDLWLRRQTATGAVAEFPFELETEQIHVYYTLENGKPYLGGFFSAFPPAQFSRIEPILTEFPNENGLATLENLGVRYLLMQPSAYEDFEGIEAELRDLGLTRTAAFEETVVYLIDPEGRASPAGGDQE